MCRSYANPRREKRFIIQEVILIFEKYLARPNTYHVNPTDELLSLAGAWSDERAAEIYSILPVTQSVIETFAGLKADLQTAGAPLDDMDFLIVATALSPVTGLLVVNWAK